ncbi:MAG: DUF262 and DUF1524 domain-containing protein [Actinomycetota bacterium]|jgi:uncharacterized protein with ParB-like and HNH nuclease domain|nr:DUF262 and DUF1524 domain-containing protein [Actinomycetota bacterium]
MKATETQLLDFLNGDKQYVIPIYQRTYSWTLNQCRQLWEDVLRAGREESGSNHFIGSIVYIQDGLFVAGGYQKLLVIDGQQRLTTISLLLAALSVIDTDSDEEFMFSEQQIRDTYLLNKFAKGEERYKLLLTQSDQDTLKSIVDETELPEKASTRVKRNYQFFLERIRSSEVSPNDLYRGIAKLIVVNISLDRNNDSPQLIFESLNSTGLDLSQADLIRNYILMGLEPETQEEIYNKYWFRMEQNFSEQKNGSFDRFVRDYLTLKSRTIPQKSEVYGEFKKYVNSLDKSVEEIVKDVYEHSKYFVKLAFLKEEDLEIRQTIQNINSIDVEVVYPLLLKLYADYDCPQRRLLREDFISILKLIESYVFRRQICAIPANTLGRTFATFSREIDEDNYLKSVEAAFLLQDSPRRFPKDEEFRHGFTIQDIFNLKIRKYLLDKLENCDRKEKVRVEDYTIEHVMPQNENLSEEWKKELGEDWEKIHADYLHTIGNLTLTGYNSELSDRPFKEKQNMEEEGFKNSPLRLNRSLARVEQWNKDAIKSRAESLADIALEIWKPPSMTRQELDGYREKSPEEDKSRSLDLHSENLHGEMMDLFQSLRNRIVNLDPSVKQEIKKIYITYKTTTDFVDVTPQKKSLRLSLNMRFEDIHDPLELCRDIAGKGRWGNIGVMVSLSAPDQLDDVMDLVGQSFALHSEEIA